MAVLDAVAEATSRADLCTRLLGPGFVRVRDVRPGGPHRNILVDGSWAALFDALAGDAVTPSDDRSRQLIEELAGAGLALRLGEFHHLLPFHRRRAPIPASGR